jgi:CBS domain-containing protein
MKVGDVCTRHVYLARANQPLADAARRMCVHHVGALVVIEPGDEKRRPIGILTDRDIVLGQLARSADLFCLTVGDVMTPNPLWVTEDLSVFAAISALNGRSVRRAPVLDRKGALVGFVTLDDLLPVIGAELSAIGTLMSSQAPRETREPEHPSVAA